MLFLQIGDVFTKSREVVLNINFDVCRVTHRGVIVKQICLFTLTLGIMQLQLQVVSHGFHKNLYRIIHISLYEMQKIIC